MESNKLNFNSDSSSSLDSDDTNSSVGQRKKIDDHEDLVEYPEQDESEDEKFEEDAEENERHKGYKFSSGTIHYPTSKQKGFKRRRKTGKLRDNSCSCARSINARGASSSAAITKPKIPSQKIKGISSNEKKTVTIAYFKNAFHSGQHFVIDTTNSTANKVIGLIF